MRVEMRIVIEAVAVCCCFSVAVGTKYSAARCARDSLYLCETVELRAVGNFPERFYARVGIIDRDGNGEDHGVQKEVVLDLVWSKISNALKKLGFRSHNFLAQLLSETSRACTGRGCKPRLSNPFDFFDHTGGSWINYSYCKQITY